MTTKLPEGYWITERIYGGSGHGDEQFGLKLERWQSYTVGRLWWKRTRRGWVTVAFAARQSVEDWGELKATARQMHLDEQGAKA